MLAFIIFLITHMGNHSTTNNIHSNGLANIEKTTAVGGPQEILATILSTVAPKCKTNKSRFNQENSKSASQNNIKTTRLEEIKGTINVSPLLDYIDEIDDVTLAHDIFKPIIQTIGNNYNFELQKAARTRWIGKPIKSIQKALADTGVLPTLAERVLSVANTGKFEASLKAFLKSECNDETPSITCPDAFLQRLFSTQETYADTY